MLKTTSDQREWAYRSVEVGMADNQKLVDTIGYMRDELDSMEAALGWLPISIHPLDNYWRPGWNKHLVNWKMCRHIGMSGDMPLFEWSDQIGPCPPTHFIDIPAYPDKEQS